jgi:hypothetical protein
MIVRIVVALVLLTSVLCTAQNTPLAEKLLAESPWQLTFQPIGGGNIVSTTMPFRRTPEGRLEVRVSSTKWVEADVVNDKTVRFDSNRGHKIVVSQNARGEVSATHDNARTATFVPVK